MKKLMLSLLTAAQITSLHAMTPGTSTIKHKAFFVNTPQGLYEPLDLKFRRIRFDQADFDWCGKNLKREKNTLNFSCEFQLPKTASVSKLRKMMSVQTLSVDVSGRLQVVDLSVDPEARKFLVRTSFDKTGIDFDLVQFNKDFLRVHSKMAQLVFAEALNSYSLEMEILESPNSLLTKHP